MKLPEKPLIYLLNTPINIQNTLREKKFNAHYKRMNGYKKYSYTYGKSLYIPYKNEIPLDIHEAEVVVIDTQSKNYFIAQADEGVNVYYKDIQSLVHLTPLDTLLAIRKSFSTDKKQLIIFFASEYISSKYTLFSDGNLQQPIEADSLWLPNSRFNISQRNGSRININQDGMEKEIKNCLAKYLDDAVYSVAIQQYSSDTVLAVNDANETVSLIRYMQNKIVMILPSLENKEDFLSELFEKILPEHPDFKILFPNNENYTWTKDFSYISIEERNKSIEINDEFKRHEERLALLQYQYESIHSKNENLKLRNILKETGDDLVSSVKWFLEYIGFNDVVDPDKDVDINAGEVYEEDLNFEHNGVYFLFEVKGIRGTSTDAQCAQISKIALRRKRANSNNTYKAVYVVNHQRNLAPKERVLIPFNENQIDDAEMAQRGMTFTYELFNIYHMIEAGIISKEAAREAFKQEGLIDFRQSLHKLDFNHCYDKQMVYSLIIPEGTSFSVSKFDKIAIQNSENHWNLLSIESIEIDRIPYEEVSRGKVGIKVDRLVSEARDFYVVKTSEVRECM